MSEHNQQFETFEEWCSKAPAWLTRHPQYNVPTFRALCFDTLDRVCASRKEFERARDEDVFPVRWLWPDQAFAAVKLLRYILDIDAGDVKTHGAEFLLEMIIDKAESVMRISI